MACCKYLVRKDFFFLLLRARTGSKPDFSVHSVIQIDDFWWTLWSLCHRLEGWIHPTTLEFDEDYCLILMTRTKKTHLSRWDHALFSFFHLMQPIKDAGARIAHLVAHNSILIWKTLSSFATVLQNLSFLMRYSIKEAESFAALLMVSIRFILDATLATARATTRFDLSSSR